MAKTTATVTVGADTGPFERKMRSLGRGLAGGATVGVQRVGGMAMSGLGAGLGIGAAFLGLRTVGSTFDQLRAVSPQLNAELTKLKVAIGDALVPVALGLAEMLNRNLPTIEAELKMFGNALGDAIQFWTEDAFDPAVWKDIGYAIVDSVRDAANSTASRAFTSATGQTPQEFGIQFAVETAVQRANEGTTSWFEWSLNRLWEAVGGTAPRVVVEGANSL